MVDLNRDVIRQVIAAVDWGFTNPGVLQVWGLDSDRRMYLVHEVYRTGQLIEWWIERAKEARRHFGIEVFICDPAEPAYINQFRAAGLPVEPAYNEVGAGLQAVTARLKPAGDGRPRLFVLEGALAERDEGLAEKKLPLCTEQEFEVYSWQKSADGRPVKEEPVKVYDHGMDAGRYAVAYVDHLTDEPPNPLDGIVVGIGVRGWQPRKR